jgi:thioester reductase-like protein
VQPVRTVFLTGATGAIGSALAAVLLQEPATQLQLLLRATSRAELDRRLESLFQFWQVDPADVTTRRRVVAAQGDATAPSFGLDVSAYADLSARCTHIIHAAGAVRMNLPIEDARRSAVESARNIVQLAHSCRNLSKVEFVSTVGVGGRLGGLLKEQWIDGPRTFHNTYEQAKAEAEEFVRGEVERGLPLTVHRPSMVVGDSRTGRIIHFQIFYHLCEFLSGTRTFGLAPGLDRARLDTVPVDYVASAIAWSSQQLATSSRVFHLCSGPELSIPLAELQTLVRAAYADAGRRTPPVIALPSWVFLGVMQALGMLLGESAQRAIRTLPVFIDYLTTEQAFGNAQSQESLAAGGVALPPPQAYLPRALSRYLASREQDRNARK